MDADVVLAGIGLFLIIATLLFLLLRKDRSSAPSLDEDAMQILVEAILEYVAVQTQKEAEEKTRENPAEST